MARKIYREGRHARLFPTVSSGEDRATSIFLSVLDSVEPFRQEMMKSIGLKYENESQHLQQEFIQSFLQEI